MATKSRKPTPAQAGALDLVRAGRVTLNPADCVLVDGQEPTDDALRIELENLYINEVIDAAPHDADHAVRVWVRAD
jgi:hypothetical protein